MELRTLIESFKDADKSDQDHLLVTVNGIDYLANSNTNPTGVIAMKNGKKVGQLTTSGQPFFVNGDKYLRISLVDVDKANRKHGIATNLYKALLMALKQKTSYAGLISFKSEIGSRGPIEKIHKRIGGRTRNDYEDQVIIPISESIH
jgi:predicted GNAT family acetyltransferase